MGLRNDANGVENWYSAPLARFKEALSAPLSGLILPRYTLADARNRREPAEYAQTMIRRAKSSSLTSTSNQLTFVYEGLTAELRRNIRPSTENTTVGEYI